MDISPENLGEELLVEPIEKVSCCYSFLKLITPTRIFIIKPYSDILLDYEVEVRNDTTGN